MRKGRTQSRALGFGALWGHDGRKGDDDVAAVEAALPHWFDNPEDHAMALDLCLELADHEDAEVRLAVARGISCQLAHGPLSTRGDQLNRLVERMLRDRDARIREIASSLRGNSPG